MRPVLRALVPRAWTGEEALAAVGVLNQAIDAIWQLHGEQMAAVIADRPHESWDAAWSGRAVVDTTEEDSPF